MSYFIQSFFSHKQININDNYEVGGGDGVESSALFCCQIKMAANASVARTRVMLNAY